MISSGDMVEVEAIVAECAQVLEGLGAGRVNSVAYDTAWVARLSHAYDGIGFDGALPWLRRHQHRDGSWGGDVIHFHDRYICTLTSAIALRDAGNGSADQERIDRALDFLWREHLRLRLDAHETIGFSVLAVSLVEEARSLGLRVPPTPYVDTNAIDRKLSILQRSPHLWRNSTMSFSLEAVRARFPETPDFLETNGSVGTSPAATASLLLRSQGISQLAMDYLNAVVNEDGGIPNVSPIDTFETAWSLNYLRHTGVISPSDPPVRRALDMLWSRWSDQHGMSFSSYYSVPNLDDTAVSYSVLRWGGYPASTNAFAEFEELDHFRCFSGEIDHSVSAALRLIDALKVDTSHPFHDRWMAKALGMLPRAEDSGITWFDKWHASPYYLLCNAVQVLRGITDDLLAAQVQWIISTQNFDGGWGYYGDSTLEETAYSLLALINWDEYAQRIDPNRIRAALEYLRTNYQSRNFTPLWLGKCLYTPELVVRSIIIAALYRGSIWLQS